MGYELGKNTKRNLYTILQSGNHLSSVLVKAVEEFIKVTPIDFCIISNGGYRTAEEQKVLFDKGVSRCDGTTHKSNHQGGLAVDLVPWVDGSMTWEKAHAYYLSGAFIMFCIERGYNVTSGSDWNRDGNLKDGWDPCHMEIKA